MLIRAAVSQHQLQCQQMRTQAQSALSGLFQLLWVHWGASSSSKRRADSFHAI
jgi:hypothetical protein